MIASRKLDNCEAAAREIESATGRRAVPFECHVGRWQDCDRLVESVYRELGRCDVLVNNAGMSPAYDSLTSVTEDLYDKVHAVNARGPFRLSVLIGERMAQGDGGSIINVSSVGSWRPTATDLPYAMAKAALNALTLGLAGAWAPKVRANLVLPSACDTDLTDELAVGDQVTHRRDESDAAHGDTRGPGGSMRLSGQRRGQLRQRRAGARRRGALPHALRARGVRRELPPAGPPAPTWDASEYATETWVTANQALVR